LVKYALMLLPSTKMFIAVICSMPLFDTAAAVNCTGELVVEPEIGEHTVTLPAAAWHAPEPEEPLEPSESLLTEAVGKVATLEFDEATGCWPNLMPLAVELEPVACAGAGADKVFPTVGPPDVVMPPLFEPSVPLPT
jgi:hypothetical protein